MSRSHRPDILRVLEEANGPLTVAAVAEAVGIAYSTAGTQLLQLRKLGQAHAELMPSLHGGPPSKVYTLIEPTLVHTLPEQHPSPFDDDPWWSDVAAAMKHAAREREEKHVQK